MASKDKNIQEETSENFECLLQEDSDIEYGKAEYHYYIKEENHDEFVEPKQECIVLEHWEQDPESDGPLPMTVDTTVMKEEYNPESMTSQPLAESMESSDNQVRRVVVIIVGLELEGHFDDDVMIEENPLHLANDQQVRGRGCATRQGPFRKKKEKEKHRTIEVKVDVNDENVPKEFKEMLMQVVAEQFIAEENIESTVEAPKEKCMNSDNNAEKVKIEGGNSASFVWSSMSDYKSERERFLPEKTGPVGQFESAYGAFRRYWDDGILSHIVTETNRCAVELVSSSASFACDWYDTNIHEVLVIFAFWMMLGIIRMPSTKSCSTMNSLLKTDIFRKMFSRNRYEYLCRALDLTDNKRPTDGSISLFGFDPILKEINSRFMEAYIPNQNICVAESLSLMKQNQSLRQYTESKAPSFEMKTFELLESSTGYTWSFFLYPGTDTTPSKRHKRIPTVLKLIGPLLDKGYTIFMGNLFNSPLLARFLKSRKTDCVGTLRANRPNVPRLISLCELEEGQVLVRHSSDVVVLAYQDKKEKIISISTYHGDSKDRMVSNQYDPRSSQKTPQLILDYNKAMESVDRKELMLDPYLLEGKRCPKWNMVLKRLINMSASNARILLLGPTGIFKEHLVFRLQLIEQILNHHLNLVPKPAPVTTPTSLNQSRMSEEHLPRRPSS